MFGERYTVRTGSVALVANTTKSVFLIPPGAAGKFNIVELSIAHEASASALPVAWELYEVTTLGSPAGTNFTPVKVNRENAATAQTGTCLINLSTEVTAVEVIKDWTLQPFGGLLVMQYPLGREVQSQVATTKRIGLRYVNPASGTTTNYRVYVEFEE